MSTVSRHLPERPHLDVPKREARELLDAWRARELQALDRIRRRHPKYPDATNASLKAAPFKLADAQRVIAAEYGFDRWSVLKQKIESHALTGALRVAIEANEAREVVRILRGHPHLVHLPVRSGNWGPPMSHAANLGRLEIVQAVAALGARDFQHAFDRALLQGQIATARWLRTQGAQIEPGSVMGACETLNSDGLRFLLELGAPVADDRGNRLAPLALALETRRASMRCWISSRRATICPIRRSWLFIGGGWIDWPHSCGATPGWSNGVSARGTFIPPSSDAPKMGATACAGRRSTT